MTNLKILILLAVFFLAVHCKEPEAKAILKRPSRLFENLRWARKRLPPPAGQAAPPAQFAGITPEEQEWNKIMPDVTVTLEISAEKFAANKIFSLSCHVKADRQSPEYNVHFMGGDLELGFYNVKQTATKTEFTANEANLITVRHTVLEKEENPTIAQFMLYVKAEDISKVKEYTCRFELPDKKHPFNVSSNPVHQVQ